MKSRKNANLDEMEFKPNKKLRSAKDMPTAVLPSEYTENIQTEEVVTVTINNKQFISKIVKDLCCYLPLKHLQHLKRVRLCSNGQHSVILCPSKLYEASGVKEFLSQHNIDLNGFDDDIKMINVATKPPITRIQYEEGTKLWPISFHANKYIEKLMTGELLSNQEIEVAEKFMRLAIKCAESAKAKEMEPVGAIIVDPKTQEVLITAEDLRGELNPLKHAVMVAVDSVATLQGGGAWSNAEPRNGADSSSKTPYLCTGYDLYVTREPCIMCSMALVHSRIRRVFYATPHPKTGGLGSLYQIHHIKGVNHHFEVFSNMLSSEVIKLWNS